MNINRLVSRFINKKNRGFNHCLKKYRMTPRNTMARRLRKTKAAPR